MVWGQPWRLMNSTLVLIWVEKPEEKAAICKCRYIKNALLNQQPCLQMVSQLASPSLRAIVPLEQREWLPTFVVE